VLTAFSQRRTLLTIVKRMADASSESSCCNYMGLLPSLCNAITIPYQKHLNLLHMYPSTQIMTRLLPTTTKAEEQNYLKRCITRPENRSRLHPVPTSESLPSHRAEKVWRRGKVSHHRGDRTFVVDGQVLTLKGRMTGWQKFQD
jgi:hypothetical protein